MAIELNHADFPQAVIDTEQAGRLIIKVKDVEVDVMYHHDGVSVTINQEGASPKETFADFEGGV